MVDNKLPVKCMCDKKLSVEMYVCNGFIRNFQYNTVNLDREHVPGVRLMDPTAGKNLHWKNLVQTCNHKYMLGNHIYQNTVIRKKIV